MSWNEFAGVVHSVVYLYELERALLGVVHRVVYLCELERA